MKINHLKSITFLSLTLTLIFALVLTGTVNHLFAQEGDSAIFLPVVANGESETTDGQGRASSNWAVRGQHLILWQNDSAGPASEQVGQWSLNYDILDVSGLIDAGQEAAAEAVVESFRASSNVSIVEPNYVYTSTGDLEAGILDEFIPNDPRQGQQFAWALIDGYEAWDITQGDASTVIAVIDTGVDLDHPDLVDKLVGGFDFVDDDELADDGNGHGTHVAGTAAASTDNGIDGAGTCPNCSIMPLRALNNQGSGSLADIAAAVEFATNNGADVINMSLGARAQSAILQRAVAGAFQRGVFLACAAGNDNSSELSFPAGFDGCMSVASVTQSDSRSSFSNFGETVEVAAPGSDILSTVPGGQTGSLNGTSMASPHVAGLAGLLSSQGLDNEEIRERLCDTAVPIAGTGEFWTCGRINMLAAVSNGEQTPDPDVTPTPSPTPSPTASPTASPTPSPMPDPAETPIPSADPIVDGGFEEIDGWTLSDPAIRSSQRPVSGQFSARLGGENDSTDLAEQTVVIPDGGQLSYAWIASDIYGYGVGRLDESDRLLLELTFDDGVEAQVVLQHPSRQGQWFRPVIDLSEFAGESVVLRFRAETNGSSPTVFFVDDVTMSASSGAAVR